MSYNRKNNGRKSITRIISVLLYVGLISSFVDVFTIVFRTEDQQGSITIISVIHYVPIILLDACGILSFIFERKYFPKYIRTCFNVLMLWMIYLTIRDYPRSTEINILFSSKGLMTWLICSLIFVSSNRERIIKFEKLTLYSLVILSIYGIFQALSLSYGFTRSDSLKLLLLIMVNLFWVLAYYFLGENKEKNKTIINIALAVLVATIILTLTQSYVLLFIILVACKVFSMKSKKGVFNEKSLILFLISLFLILIVLSSDYYNVIEYAINHLINRSSESKGSRIDQLSEFLSQFKITDLFFGAGPDSTWNWTARVEPYQYVDNQIVLLLWFGGLIPTIMYFVIFISPGLKVIFSKRKDVGKNTGYIAFLWLLAMCGLAIYTTYSNNFYYYLFCIYAGINISKSQVLESTYSRRFYNIS